MWMVDGSDIILEKTCFGVICLGHLGNAKLQNSYCMTFFWFLRNQFYEKSTTFAKFKTIIRLGIWIDRVDPIDNSPSTD